MAKAYTNTFTSATFTDDPYRKVKVSLNSTIINEYIPALHRALPDASKGLQYLLIAMTHQEGFKAGTRSYRTNNPGNIGNTDAGANKVIKTLEDGIKLQAQFLQDIADGKKKAYPLGKEMNIKPYYSPEIAKNEKLYGISPFVPGYKFIFTGGLDQFVKIYSTGSRSNNNYLNVIVSYFKQNGIDITPESKLQDIILLN